VKKTAFVNLLLSGSTIALFVSLMTATPSVHRTNLPDASKISKERLFAFSAAGRGSQRGIEMVQETRKVPDARENHDERMDDEKNKKNLNASTTIPEPAEPPKEPPPIKPTSFETKLPFGKLTQTIPYPSHEQTVYLTFDDGPGPYTKEIVSILDQNHIQGSFFWVGQNLANWLKKDASNDSFAHEMLSKGEVIGSHTMEHTALGHKSYQMQLQLMQESAEFISAKIGHPITYFRPPYGSVDHFTEKASETTKQIIVYWKVDSEDWRYPRDPVKVLNNIMSEVGPGSIILLHEKSTTVDMLQHIIDTLKEKGYSFAALPTPKE
jgi:peptidoglycan-N-acetylglucosamine deacetylase